MEETLREIRNVFLSGRVKWRVHALGRLLERGISRDDVLSVIGDGEIIESYPSSKPLPSYLIYGVTKQRPLHVVIGWDVEGEVVYVVTVYEPDLEHFEVGFRTRRVK